PTCAAQNPLDWPIARLVIPSPNRPSPAIIRSFHCTTRRPTQWISQVHTYCWPRRRIQAISPDRSSKPMGALASVVSVTVQQEETSCEKIGRASWGKRVDMYGRDVVRK